jgi:hypothetical protein
MFHLKFQGVLVLTFLVHILAFPQIHTPPDTLFLRAAIDHAKNTYEETTKSYSRLYNGKEYIEFKKNMPEIGTLFFHSDEWEEGRVLYDGELYENVLMRFDLLTEKLVVEHKGYGEIELISEKINYFEIVGHTFIRQVDQPGAKSLITPGFYDLIYEGNTRVLVKRWKVTEERVETQFSMILTFKEKNAIYIFKAGKYYPVSRKSSVLKVFDDQKSALKKFISKNHIKYRGNREDALVKIAGHYDELSR